MSVSFTGSNYLQFASPNIPNVQAAKTITFWYFCASVATLQSFVNGVNQSTSVGYQMGIRSNNLTLWSYGGTGLVSQAAIAGQWVFVSYTFDGTTHRLMQNMGTAVTSTSAPQSGIPAHCQIAGNFWNENLSGRMEDIRLYDRVLSDAELQTIYASNGLDKILEGLRLYLPAVTDFVDFMSGQTPTSVGAAPVVQQERIASKRRNR